jgi:ElaB protein
MDNNLENKIGSNRDGVTQIGKDLRSDAHSAIDKVAEQVPPLTDRLAEHAHSGVDAVADRADGAAARSRQLASSYKRFAESGRGYVRTSPVTSVLLAAAAGYGLSKLFGLRK